MTLTQSRQIAPAPSRPHHSIVARRVGHSLASACDKIFYYPCTGRLITVVTHTRVLDTRVMSNRPVH
jgi:hypothetical protein